LQVYFRTEIAALKSDAVSHVDVFRRTLVWYSRLNDEKGSTLWSQPRIENGPVTAEVVTCVGRRQSGGSTT
jgi:hypothetical protein